MHSITYHILGSTLDSNLASIPLDIVRVTLTDGWCIIGTRLDTNMERLVRAGRIKTGDKVD